MIRLALQALLCLGLCPLLTAQQSQPASTFPDTVLTSPAPHPAAEAQPLDAASERILVLRKARTVSIDSKTVFLTTSTLERALLKNQDWEKLDLNIVSHPSGADLQIDVDRLPFTHIHTYTLTDRKTGIVLTSGRIRAFDGVIASGPMAEKIISVIFAARFPALPVKQ